MNVVEVSLSSVCEDDSKYPKQKTKKLTTTTGTVETNIDQQSIKVETVRSRSGRTIKPPTRYEPVERVLDDDSGDESGSESD